ncbi:MAG: lipoyl domain-containing protein [Candidatus Omnitrophota bacterium]
MLFKLPKITKGEDSAVVTNWHVKSDERVKKDQDIVEVSTDKATFDVASPCDGVLKKILKRTGDDVRSGEIIAEIEQ